jgi:hypothetical protein
MCPVQLYSTFTHYVSSPTLYTLCVLSNFTTLLHIMCPVQLYNTFTHYVSSPTLQHFTHYVSSPTLQHFYTLCPVQIYNTFTHYVSSPTLQHFYTLCVLSNSTILLHITCPVQLYNTFTHYPIHGMALEKMAENKMCVLTEVESKCILVLCNVMFILSSFNKTWILNFRLY